MGLATMSKLVRIRKGKDGISGIVISTGLPFQLVCERMTKLVGIRKGKEGMR